MSCLALFRAALLVAPLALPSSSLAAIRSGLDPAVIQRDLASVVPEEMARRHLVGAVVVIVDREGVILAEGYGHADLDQQTPVRPEHTTFRAASVSKLLTTTAVVQLVERGSIDLDRELATYIEGLELPCRDGRPITPRHLLTHSAGLSEGFIGSQARTRPEWLPLRDYVGRGLPAQFASAGEIISYANYDIGLAGLLVESVNGLPFHEVVSREILQPLGMSRSSFGMEPAVLDGIAQGYVFVSGSQRRIPVDFRNNRASGGLVTSGLDMGRFLRVFLNGGEVDGTRILRPETTAAMLSRQLSQHPGMKGIGFGFWELEIDGRSYWGHDGDVVGWNARALLMPERGLGLFMAYTGTDTLKAFGDRVASTVFGPSQPPSAPERLPRAVVADAGRLDGLYRWTHRARDGRSSVHAVLAGAVPGASGCIWGAGTQQRAGPLPDESLGAGRRGSVPRNRWGSKALLPGEGRKNHSPLPGYLPHPDGARADRVVGIGACAGDARSRLPGGVSRDERLRSRWPSSLASAQRDRARERGRPCLPDRIPARDGSPHVRVRSPAATGGHRSTRNSAVLLRRSARRTVAPGAAGRGARHRRRTRRSNGARSWGPPRGTRPRRVRLAAGRVCGLPPPLEPARLPLLKWIRGVPCSHVRMPGAAGSTSGGAGCSATSSWQARPLPNKIYLDSSRKLNLALDGIDAEGPTAVVSPTSWVERSGSGP